jgi:3-hydroxyisobutyrate dehydrogenase-like beta-hydroxyacid dehydrogenase
MSDVAFIGLGRMGSRMARRLIEAGHNLTVWNRTREKAEPLVELGAVAASTPAEAAAGAEAVITMVADPQSLESVSEGSAGIAATVSDSSTVIEMSTVGPEAVLRLASILPEEAGALDAPVLGSLSEAETGTLKVFVGGPDELASRWTPLLSAMGTPLYAGPLGSGATVKLVANSTILGVLGVLGEALALADVLGVPQEKAFEVLAVTPLAAQAERRRPQVELGDSTLRFSMALAQKDAELITETAAASGLEMRLANAVRSWLVDAVEAGRGESDYSQVIAYIKGSQ